MKKDVSVKKVLFNWFPIELSKNIWILKKTRIGKSKFKVIFYPKLLGVKSRNMALTHTSLHTLSCLIILLASSGDFKLKSETQGKGSITVGVPKQLPSKLGEDSRDVTDFLDTMESLHKAHFFTEQVQGHKVSGGETVIGSLSSDPVYSSHSEEMKIFFMHCLNSHWVGLHNWNLGIGQIIMSWV